ncbi:MAG: HAD family hydrolase [Candidatus Omnitrophica bacterium]|nr:HAD family hydrolase [Candidatus Omnitrophota bacterium]
MKLILLDRDGVICRFRPGDYAKTWEEFEFLPGSINALKKFNQAGYSIVIASNQAGVGKGIYSQAALEEITRKMLEVLTDHGVHIAQVFYCVHTDEDNCPCRKPKPGMLLRAAEELQLPDLRRTFFIGDASTDVEAGKNAGARTILVLSGKTRSPEETASWSVQPDFIAHNLSEAVEIVLREEGGNGRI